MFQELAAGSVLYKEPVIISQSRVLVTQSHSEGFRVSASCRGPCSANMMIWGVSH